MSTFYQEWDLLSKKIKALLETGAFLYQTFQKSSSDEFGAIKIIRNEVVKLFRSIEEFERNYKSQLPPIALSSLASYIETSGKHASQLSMAQGLIEKNTVFLLIDLSLLEANLTHALGDRQTKIRKTVEIAFSHLQRQIVADKNVRQLWEDVSNKEVDYEKLGGAHLLLHKIWAFKVHSEGERTDLVLSERVNESDILFQSVDGLVLTEWKVASQDNVLNKINEAKSQASRYSKGALSSIELSNYRYLVMVSKDVIHLDQNEIKENDIIYRLINIACSPKAPSQDSRKKVQN